MRIGHFLLKNSKNEPVNWEMTDAINFVKELIINDHIALPSNFDKMKLLNTIDKTHHIKGILDTLLTENHEIRGFKMVKPLLSVILKNHLHKEQILISPEVPYLKSGNDFEDNYPIPNFFMLEKSNSNSDILYLCKERTLTPKNFVLVLKSHKENKVFGVISLLDPKTNETLKVSDPLAKALLSKKNTLVENGIHCKISNNPVISNGESIPAHYFAELMEESSNDLHAFSRFGTASNDNFSIWVESRNWNNYLHYKYSDGTDNFESRMSEEGYSEDEIFKFQKNRLMEANRDIDDDKDYLNWGSYNDQLDMDQQSQDFWEGG
jgi:hypothetical protein